MLRGKMGIERQIFTDSHAKTILTTMNNLRKDDTLCDITLKVEDQNFSAHRIVLAACSDYFRAMFTNEMWEKNQSTVELHGIHANVMEVLLDFVYTETVNVDVENVQELLPAACLLQLTGVKLACSDFLEKQLDATNCLGIRTFAESHSCNSLKDAAETFCYKHFDEIVHQEEFVSLEASDLESLIASEELQVTAECPVYEAVIDWVCHDVDNRADSLPLLLSHVRLPLMNVKYLTDVVDTEPLVRRNHACRDLLDEAKKYHLRPDLRNQMQCIRTKARTGAKEFLVVAGGFGSLQSPIDAVEIYDSKLKSWSTLPPLEKRRRYVAATAVRSKVYIIGGFDGTCRLDNVDCIDLDEDDPKWSYVAPLQHRRGLAGVCTYQDGIFVCGGFDGIVRHTSMERYDPHIDQWSTLGNMTIGREGAGLVVVCDMIYCIGGYDGVNLLNSVERFDPSSGRWAVMPCMSQKRSGAGVAVLHDSIYVCGGYDGTEHLKNVECFSVTSGQWTSVSDMTVPRCYVGACIMKGKLFVVGGYDGANLLDTIECYDVTTQQWQKVDSNMSVKRCDAGVCVVQPR